MEWLIAFNASLILIFSPQTANSLLCSAFCYVSVSNVTMNNGCRLRLSATQGMTINRIINRVSPGYHYTTYGHNRCLLCNNIITLLILNQIKLLAESDFYTRERDKKFSSLCSEKCVIVDPWDPLLILQTRALSLSPPLLLSLCFRFNFKCAGSQPRASSDTRQPGADNKEMVSYFTSFNFLAVLVSEYVWVDTLMKSFTCSYILFIASPRSRAIDSPWSYSINNI